MNTQETVSLLNQYRDIIDTPTDSRIDDNLELYQKLYNTFTKEVNQSVKDVKLNISFCSPYGELNDYRNSDYLDLELKTRHINVKDFDDFIFGRKALADLIKDYCLNYSCDVHLSSEIVNSSYSSWDKYLLHVRYDDTNLIVPPETQLLEQCLIDKGIVWCHNKSCSGKTYTAINIFKKLQRKSVFNPCSLSSCDYEFVKLVLVTGRNYALLIDDIQCDIDKAKELMNIVCNLNDDLIRRNIKVFFISWTALFENPYFKAFEKKINIFHTSPEDFVELFKRRISDSRLLEICGNNIALLHAAVDIGLAEKNIVAEDALFSSFVFVKNDTDKIRQIYKLCVLGAYEYEPSIRFIGSPELTDKDIRTIKKFGDFYNTGHRQICAFIVSYLEKKNYELPSKDSIIREYILASDNEKKWKLLKQLIGESSKNDLLTISPIWGALHEFENEISRQSKKDPSWQNTPSSMYFVLSVASLLGVIDDYEDVVSAFCNNFYISDNHLHLKYNQLKTTTDFSLIRKRMICEDKHINVKGIESGKEFICNTAHKNWVLGLVVGLRQELEHFGQSSIFETALNDLKATQCDDGYWYPKRVPWITARILIGLRQAGFTYSDNIVKKGVDHLLNILHEELYWQAYTGGWNTVYETSALCLDAVIGSGYPNYRNDKRIKSVANYLNDEQQKWMADDQEIDGSITACVLLKYFGVKDYLLDYITKICERRIFEIIQDTCTLDYSTRQSCDTTQIANFVIELCWYILEQDLPTLLREYILRSQFDRKSVKMKKIFISYCDEGKSFVSRISKITDKLSAEGHEVFSYADAPLGTNNIDFMRKIDLCDLILIMGTKKYKQKAEVIKQGGVTYEDLIINSSFMTTHREKIIPIAFDSFDESIPRPLNTNKGLPCKRVDKKFLDKLICEINKK